MLQNSCKINSVSHQFSKQSHGLCSYLYSIVQSSDKKRWLHQTLTWDWSNFYNKIFHIEISYKIINYWVVIFPDVVNFENISYRLRNCFIWRFVLKSTALYTFCNKQVYLQLFCTSIIKQSWFWEALNENFGKVISVKLSRN